MSAPAATRPELTVAVVGTATEVGKTWVGSRSLGSLAERGFTVAARKPVQSFSPADHSTDADELATASGEDPFVVCAADRRLEVPMAPPMAADALGRPRILLDDLIGEIDRSWGEHPASIGLVELVGGVRSPIAHDGDCVDFIAALAPDVVVLVADAGLGTINAVISAVDSLATIPGPLAAPLALHLNHYDATDDLHRRNHEHLTDPSRLALAALTTTPDELASELAEKVRAPTS